MRRKMTQMTVRPSTTNAGTEASPPVDLTMAARGKRFDDLVRRAMSDVGIPTVTELARDTFITRDTWYDWFRGERAPRRTTLVKAADVLGLSVDQLMDPWESGPRIITMTDEQFDAALTRAAERVAELVVERLSQAQTTQPPPQEVLREVAEAEADLARQLDSEKQRRSADQPRSGEGSSGLPRPRE